MSNSRSVQSEGEPVTNLYLGEPVPRNTSPDELLDGPTPDALPMTPGFGERNSPALLLLPLTLLGAMTIPPLVASPPMPTSLLDWKDSMWWWLYSEAVIPW